ncbi:MAG: carbon starvation protein A [Planctomycetota bacterium]|nr:carbon starvation protein A [Planctomycetota bacterium]
MNSLNSLWLVITALAAFAVAYRFYGAFLAAKVGVLNDNHPTPAHRLKDGVDYHPTKRLVLFGHHFAAIAGPGPLIGPVLASQWGYFPGFAWIVIGACLAGGVHDFVILLASVRNDGLTLPKIARTMIGPVSGATTAIATLFIVVAVLASVAIVVVNALSESAWGMFTILVTIPAALLTGAWMYKIRPGKIGEASVIGVTIVLLGVILGKPVAGLAWGQYLIFSKPTLSIMLPCYAAIASILPVWVLMCPRDYLSSYMKIGVIVVLAVGIFAVHPPLRMPATTHFLAGGGPVVSGAVWPFVCIVIMCGALSGFHALIASGTTPKMINKESDIRPIGYGAMILEGFVALMALVAACALEPGDYFRINVPQDTAAQQAAYTALVANAQTEHGWDLQPKDLPKLEKSVQEKLVGRTGGAVTLAVGMSDVLTDLPGLYQVTRWASRIWSVHVQGAEFQEDRQSILDSVMAYWYHFVIMFEALFILTLLETGTRVARFVFQETLAQFNPKYTLGGEAKWGVNVGMSVLVCGLWGGLLYIGNLEMLWRMLGIANQLLATIALAVGTTYLLRHAPRRRYAWLTAVPLVFVIVTVFAAGLQSIHTWWHKTEAVPLNSFLLKLACVLAGVMLTLTAVITIDALRCWYGILFGHKTKPVTDPSNPAGVP